MRCKLANGRGAQSRRNSSLIFIHLLLAITIAHLTHQHPPTMAITTCSSQTKEKPIGRALAAIAPSPVERHQERRSTWLSKSPRTTSVNPLIAELNQPRARFDNVLETLRPETLTTNKTAHNNDLNLTPPTDKANQVTPQASSTGVNLQAPCNLNPATDKNPTTATTGDNYSPQMRVHISKATETVDVNLSPAASNPPSSQSILQTATKSTSHSSNSSLFDNNASQTKTNIKDSRLIQQATQSIQRQRNEGDQLTCHRICWPLPGMANHRILDGPYRRNKGRPHEFLHQVHGSSPRRNIIH